MLMMMGCTATGLGAPWQPGEERINKCAAHPKSRRLKRSLHLGLSSNPCQPWLFGARLCDTLRSRAVGLYRLVAADDVWPRAPCRVSPRMHSPWLQCRCVQTRQNLRSSAFLRLASPWCTLATQDDAPHARVGILATIAPVGSNRSAYDPHLFLSWLVERVSGRDTSD